MTIKGDQLHYDLTGSHPADRQLHQRRLRRDASPAWSPARRRSSRTCRSTPASTGRVEVDLGPEGTVVNAPWPIAVTGFCSGPYEKIMNAIFELWSKIMPERALACSFNLEYLLVGGRDARRETARSSCGTTGWSAAGAAATARTARTAPAPVFGVGLAVQPVEGQERLPGPHHRPRDLHRLRRPRDDSAAAAASRRAGADRRRTARSCPTCCDRARSITWGIEGGLPSIPHGVWLNRGERGGAVPRRRLLRMCRSGPATCSPGRPRAAAASATRSSATRRSCSRTSPTATSRSSAPRKDYGVVVDEVDAELAEYEVDARGDRGERAAIARERARLARRGRRGGRRSATAPASSTSSTSSAATA